MEHFARMPDLAQSFCGFHHNLDSALAMLCELKIPVHRVTIRMEGKGYPTRWIVEQSPAPGTAVDPGTSIELTVAGLGYFHSLPVGMWDKGGEAEAGTQEIVELLDDPLQKAAHWIREGARLFDIHPDNPAACARWITLFGVSPDAWPQETWYPLALLLPNLQSLAGTERGLRFALHLLLELPLKEIRRSPSFRYITEEDFSRVGRHHSRLSVDTIIGDRKEEIAKLTLVLGPVPLDTYYDFQQEQKSNLLKAVLGLVATCYQEHSIAWDVEDRARAPKLGQGRQNGILGINTHLGMGRTWEPEPSRKETVQTA
jgi:hypothetical protein